MTAPLVPAEADLRDFHFMPLDVARLINSDLVAIATGDEFRAAVILWCKSWHQVPAASLPNDDRMLAHLAGYNRDVRGWAKVREIALKGFVLCDDGRLYHPVVAEKAREAWSEKQGYEQRRKEFSERQRARVRKRWADTKERPAADAGPDTARNTDADTEKIPMKVTGTGTIRKDDEMTRARASFEETENAIRAIPEIGTQPVAVNVVIAPIWQLVQQGFDLETQIVPSIRRQLITARNPIKSWAYFVDGILNDAAPIPPKPAGGRNHGHTRYTSAAQQLRDAIADVKADVASRDPAA